MLQEEYYLTWIKHQKCYSDETSRVLPGKSYHAVPQKFPPEMLNPTRFIKPHIVHATRGSFGGMVLQSLTSRALPGALAWYGTQIADDST